MRWRPWSRKPKLSGIALAMEQLESKIAREDARMDEISDQFFRDGGVCCPSCGEPGYTELKLAQERREKWLSILKKKSSDRKY
jgi:DNA repair exonuclease SbcCD ATPase subunit